MFVISSFVTQKESLSAMITSKAASKTLIIPQADYLDYFQLANQAFMHIRLSSHMAADDYKGDAGLYFQNSWKTG